MQIIKILFTFAKQNTNKQKKKMNIYKFETDYKNRYELMCRALSIYTNVKNFDKDDTFLRPMLIKVLTFYILEGYSLETKGLIMDSLGINIKNINQINSELTKKGFLIKDIMNHRNKFLNPELKKLREYFLEDTQSTKLFLVQINPKKDD